MKEQASQAVPEDIATFLAKAGVPRSVFFYVILGVISGARKLLGKTADPEYHEEGHVEPPLPVGDAD